MTLKVIKNSLFREYITKLTRSNSNEISSNFVKEKDKKLKKMQNENYLKGFEDKEKSQLLNFSPDSAGIINNLNLKNSSVFLQEFAFHNEDINKIDKQQEVVIHVTDATNDK